MRPQASLVRETEPGEWAIQIGTTLVARHLGYQVASNVAYALNHDTPGTTECDEVARAILDRGDGEPAS